ncbi:peptidase M24, structural domain-containing protein, partial [Armillaria nabsnona]
PLRYNGFPRSCCTRSCSHLAALLNTEILSISITIYLDGYHGDTLETFLVGDGDAQGRILCAITSDSLKEGIATCGPGKSIGQAILHYVAGCRSQLFCRSEYFTGHAIGTTFHTKPWILHAYNEAPGIMMPGHYVVIE